MLSYKKQTNKKNIWDSITGPLSGSLMCNEMLKIIAFLTYRCFIYIIHGCPGLGVFFVKLTVNSSQVIQH